MRARDWPKGWKRLIWLTRRLKDGKGLEERKMTEDEELEAKFLAQVIFSNVNDLGAFDLRSTIEYASVYNDMVMRNRRAIDGYMAKEGILTRQELIDILDISRHTVNNTYNRPATKTAQKLFAGLGVKVYTVTDAIEKTANVWQGNHRAGYIKGGLGYIREQQFDKILEV